MLHGKFAQKTTQTIKPKKQQRVLQDQEGQIWSIYVNKFISRGCIIYINKYIILKDDDKRK